MKANIQIAQFVLVHVAIAGACYGGWLLISAGMRKMFG